MCEACVEKGLYQKESVVWEKIVDNVVEYLNGEYLQQGTGVVRKHFYGPGSSDMPKRTIVYFAEVKSLFEKPEDLGFESLELEFDYPHNLSNPVGAVKVYSEVLKQVSEWREKILKEYEAKIASEEFHAEVAEIHNKAINQNLRNCLKRTEKKEKKDV